MPNLHPQLGKIGIVLPGGSLRGAFQAGAFKAFEEHRILPAYIVGVSVGAINGAAFAGGKIEALYKTYEDIARNPRKFVRFNFYNLLRAFFWTKSILINRPLRHLIIETLAGLHEVISSGIKLDIITTDFQSGQEYIFSNHNPEHQNVQLLTNALLASAAIPIVFPPFIYKNHQLFDGGVLPKTPITFAAKEECDTVFVILTDPVESIRSEKLFNNIYNIAKRSIILSNWWSTKRDLARAKEVNQDIESFEKLKAEVKSILEKKIKEEGLRNDLAESLEASFQNAEFSFQKRRAMRIFVIGPDAMIEKESSRLFDSTSIPYYLENGYNKTIRILKELNLI